MEKYSIHSVKRELLYCPVQGSFIYDSPASIFSAAAFLYQHHFLDISSAWTFSMPMIGWALDWVERVLEVMGLGWIATLHRRCLGLFSTWTIYSSSWMIHVTWPAENLGLPQVLYTQQKSEDDWPYLASVPGAGRQDWPLQWLLASESKSKSWDLLLNRLLPTQSIWGPCPLWHGEDPPILEVTEVWDLFSRGCRHCMETFVHSKAHLLPLATSSFKPALVAQATRFRRLVTNFLGGGEMCSEAPLFSRRRPYAFGSVVMSSESSFLC